MDSPGCSGVCSECCLKQVEACTPPRGPFTAATCCPLWTVGCVVGTVGCCDPARPWQQGKTSSSFLSARQPNNRLSASKPPPLVPNGAEAAPVETSPSRAATRIGYAVFTQALRFGLVAYAFDAGGNVQAKRQLSGPFASYYERYYGEGTRVLPWDGAAKRFYFADILINASADGDAPITVFTIDPATGESTAAEVTGCKGGYPYGMAWDATTKALLLATQTEASASFCAVDPTSGEGTQMGSVLRGTSEGNSSGYYTAYVSHVQGGVAIRVGHRVVTTGTDLGKSSVALKAGRASLPSSWESLDLGTHGLPSTVRTHPDGGFVSLAPRTTEANGAPKLDIIGWGNGSRTDGDVRVLARLANAGPPQAPYIGTLGYVADSIAGSLFGALTVAHRGGTLGLRDKWTLSTLDLATGRLMEAPLSPQPSIEGAETVALAGFGLVE